MVGWDRDCPEPGVVGTGSTSVLDWLAGAQHRQGALAGARASQVWQHGKAVAAMWAQREESGWWGPPLIVFSSTPPQPPNPFLHLNLPSLPRPSCTSHSS